MKAVGETLFFQWTTGILLVATLSWVVTFAVIVWLDRPPQYRRRGNR